MSTVARSLGKGSLFEFEGKSYTASPWTYDVQAEYEKWLIARSFADLRAAAGELGAEYEDERAALRRDVNAGVYEFGSDLVRRSVLSGRGVKKLLYLCLAYAHRHEPGRVTEALVDRLEKDPAAWPVAVQAMWDANADPSPPPAGEPPAAAA
jgi:hypothetical protein